MKTSFSINLVVLAIMLNSSALAMNAKTNVGPALARGSEGRVHLFFKGHNNDYIWHATYNPSTRIWAVPYRIRDRSTGNWALTCAEPVAMTPGAIYFRGHNNFRVWWYTYSSSRGSWESRGYLSATLRGRPTEISYTPFSPSVMPRGTRSGPLPYTSVALTAVVFTQVDNKIYLQQAKEEPGEWQDVSPLPNDCSTNLAPTCCNIGDRVGVFYQARGNGLNAYQICFSRQKDDYLSGEWTHLSLPHAYTNKKIAVANYYEVSTETGLLVAYKGHNNDHIWLVLWRDTYGDITEAGSWRRLGYIEGVETSESPALVRREGSTFYLAFKPVDDTEISVGTLEIDEDNRVDAAGHTYQSIRYDR